MKRFSLAALLALGVLALARADEGAYQNLVVLARAAATDRGPDPDALAEPKRGTDALKDPLADAPLSPASTAKPAAANPETPSAVPVAAAPSRPLLWTRLYATLRPSWRRPAFPAVSSEPAVSTVAVRTPLPALMPPPDSEAVKAGERRGMAELLSTSAVVTGQ